MQRVPRAKQDGLVSLDCPDLRDPWVIQDLLEDLVSQVRQGQQVRQVRLVCRDRWEQQVYRGRPVCQDVLELLVPPVTRVLQALPAYQE